MTGPNIALVRAADLVGMPWRNGAGTTAEIAVAPDSAASVPLWRFSLADLHPGTTAFSSFDGVDRVFTVVGATGVHLRWTTSDADAAPRQPVTFSGANPPLCHAAEATRALNVMVDGTRATAVVQVLELDSSGLTTDAQSVTLAYVDAGLASVGSVAAGPGDVVLVRYASVEFTGPARILLARVDVVQ